MVVSVQQLSDDELHALSRAQLRDRTRELVAARNQLDGELARTVRRAENAQAFEGDGMKSVQSWLRGHCRLSGSAAAQLVRNGRTMEQLVAVAEGHAAGDITADQVAVIGKITAPRNLRLIDEQNGDLAGIADVLAAFAATRKHDELRGLVHKLIDRLDQDGPEPDPTEKRFLSFAKHADGSGTGRFHLDAMGMEKLQAALESIVQANRPAGDERTLPQRQADALVQLCDIHLGCGTLPLLRTVRPHVGLLIDLADLIDPSTGPAAAQFSFGATLSAARARWAACDADLTRIVLDPDGVPLDYGRTKRLVPPHLRRAVEVRDQHCAFAGCDAPTWWCEVHHILEWTLHGGDTSLENSGLLCERHHGQVHHGFRIERDTAGRWHTYRPDGTEILVLRPPGDDQHLARAG